ncbi:MAG: WYL domain-containing protein [SAR324 cluster bacterium]|nr:WYL domain-containing protein [SAR324 cluster bacterium]
MPENNTSTIMRNLVMLRMIPRAPTYITTDRILDKLTDQGYQTTLRTIQRDLNKYSEQFPLVTNSVEGSRVQAWSWMEDANLFDMPEMSPLTAFTFHLVEEFLSDMIPPAVFNYLDPHFQRAKTILSHVDSTSWARLTDKVHLIPQGHTLIPAPIPIEVLDGMYQGLLKEYQCEILYRAKGKPRAKKYTINPLGLVFRQENVYAICTFLGYDDIRHIALHRIKKVETTDTTRLVPTGFNLDDYMARNFFHYPVTNEAITIELKFDSPAALHLEETPLSLDQTFTTKGDSTFIKATVPNTNAIRWWIMGFGSQVEVLKPESLRLEFIKQVEGLAQIYSKKKNTK